MNAQYIDIEKDYKESVIKIWNDFAEIPILTEPACAYRKSPLLPKEICINSLLFIGLNPSFTEKSVISESEKVIGFYEKIDDPELRDISYFEMFKDVAKYCNSDWSHLDLFFIRETDQKVIDKLSYSEKNIDFLNAQLRISFDILERAKPKLIVVANAFASEFFGKMKTKHFAFPQIWQGFDFYFQDDNMRNKKSNFDESIGTYRIKFKNYEVPIIFSGMLSGQRSLDLGSFERLKWQIKMILDNKKMS